MAEKQTLGASTEPAPRPPRWPILSWKRILHALVLGLLQPAVPIAIFGGLSWLLWGSDWKLLPPGLPAFVAVTLVGVVAVTALVGGGLIRIGRVSLADLGIRRERLGAGLLLGGAGLAVYLVCFGAIMEFVVHGSAEVFQAVAAQSATERAFFLLVGLAIASFEEPVFRGYLQPALIDRLGLPGGILVTALIFAAWHPPFFSVAGFLVRLSLGLVTGVSRGRDRPLTAAITAHALLWPVLGLT